MRIVKAWDWLAVAGASDYKDYGGLRRANMRMKFIFSALLLYDYIRSATVVPRHTTRPAEHFGSNRKVWYSGQQLQQPRQIS